MKNKVLLKGPLLTRSGYGEQARFALRSLRSREDLFDIYIQPLQWGKTSWSVEDTEERRWIDQTIEKTINYTQQGGTFDLSIQVTIPNEFQKIAAVNIGYTAGIETTKVAHEWLLKCNEMDKVIVVSSHSKNVFLDTVYEAVNKQTGQEVLLKMNTPVESVNYPVKTFESLPEIEINVDTSFNFLTVAQFGPRKNLPNTIRWFVEEFRNDDVGLILKSNVAKNCLMDREVLEEQLRALVNSMGEKKCKLYLLHGDMTDEEMHALYSHPRINAFLALPHGEGFGLPIFEAAYSGLPVVTTGWSGQLDFLVDEDGKSRFYNVAFDLQPVQKEVVWEGVLVENSMWAFPRESSAREQMRLCYNNGVESAIVWDKSNLLERFSAEKMYGQFVSEVQGQQNTEPKLVEGISFCISTNAGKPEKTKAEVASIRKTMKAVGLPYEIIIAGVTEPFANIDATLVDTPDDANNGLLAKLRNNAAEKATHDVLVFVDDDFLFPENWAPRLVEFSATNGWQVTANKILLPDGGRFWDRATMNPHKLVSYDYPNYSKNLYQTGGFWIMRKETYESCKWNSAIPINAEKNGKLNEDIEMSLRMHNNGVILSFDKENTVWHNDDSYVELNQLTLKKEIAEKNGFTFFPPASRNFKKVIESVGIG